MDEVVPFGLTVLQPYATKIAHRLKPVENRTWCPPKYLAGNLFAVHAGVNRRYVERDDATPHVYGAVIAVARLVGYAHLTDRGLHRMRAKGHDAAAFDAWESSGFAEYFTGPFGWTLADVHALEEPVPCRGLQGLWRLPADVRERVEIQMKRAMRAGGRGHGQQVEAPG